MALLRPFRPRVESRLEIEAHALDNLRFIRETMESAASFTAVPGWGGLLVGLTALAAAFISSRQPTAALWLAVWIGEAILSFLITLLAMYGKARKADTPLLSRPGRKFAFSLAPPLVAGGLLTVALYHANFIQILPGIWLLLYGSGVASGGAFSVRVVPAMGLCFMALGATALLSPAAWGNFFMAAGFGGLHLIFGGIIAWRHGG